MDEIDFGEGHVYTRDDGLPVCTICGAAEGELLFYCPGVKLAAESLDAIFAGKIVSLEYARRIREYNREFDANLPLF